MAKYFGKLGFASTVDKGYGVHTLDVVEKDYYGELNRKNFRLTNGTGINDDLTMSNEISILFDDFLKENYERIVYVTIYDAKWKITSVEARYPRLILTTGGLYNE